MQSNQFVCLFVCYYKSHMECLYNNRLYVNTVELAYN